MSVVKQVELPPGAPRYWTIDELCAVLGKKKRTIYNMVHQRRIPFRKAGRDLKFDPKEIDEWTKKSAGR
jgi:excisionase family DNA binding protein